MESVCECLVLKIEIGRFFHYLWGHFIPGPYLPYHYLQVTSTDLENRLKTINTPTEKNL